MAHLYDVHKVPVTVSEIDLEQLAVEPERVKEMRTTVASLRLDAVAAFGFSMSRTKMAREIKAERLKVNWRQVNDPSCAVAEGDVLSMRGRGRVTIEKITGETRKGRIALLLKRTF
jgi:RNA-binding protein YlmH